MSVSLDTCNFCVCLAACLSLNLSIVYLSICLSIHLSMGLSHLPIYASSQLTCQGPRA